LIETTVEGRVGILRLNDPTRRNALSLDLNEELIEAIAAFENSPDIGAVVVTGSGSAFCAGADLSQLGASKEEGLRKIYAGFLAVANCNLPTLAAVNGAAVGAGMNLALACDLRIGSTQARFDTRFADLGLHPGGGHTWMMNRIVGNAATHALVTFGQPLDAKAARECGLLWEVCNPEELHERAVAIADRAASAPRELAQRIKATINTIGALERHEDAVEAELAPQVWSITQPEFAQRLAQLSQRISGKTS
jgi:enoyl-CoA hydratase